jgi:hypothetical protein
LARQARPRNRPGKQKGPKQHQSRQQWQDDGDESKVGDVSERGKEGDYMCFFLNGAINAFFKRFTPAKSQACRSTPVALVYLPIRIFDGVFSDERHRSA